MELSSPLTVTIGRIATFYQKNETKLTDTYIRIGTQKKINQPKDNSADYFRSEKLMRDKNGYNRIRQEIRKGLALIDVAEEVGTYIFDDLQRMKDLVESYYDSSTTDDEKARIEGEFNALKTVTSNTISNTSYNGTAVIKDTSATNPLMSISLDPNNSDTTYDIDFNSSQIPTVGALDISVGEATALSNVQTELDKAGSYVAKVAGYRYGLNSQYNLVEEKIITNNKVRSDLSDIDSAKELSEMVERSINQKSSIAMLSQANMEKSKITLLFR